MLLKLLNSFTIIEIKYKSRLMKKAPIYKFISFLVISFFFIFSIGFISFLYLIQSEYPKDKEIKQQSNFVIVATGGSNRILKGLDLIKKDINRKMLLSGVGKGVTKKQIELAFSLNKTQKKLLDCCVEMDEKSIDTFSNAIQSKIWLDSLNADSVFVVTANYHMPRLLLELNRSLNNIMIIPVPVEPLSKPIKNIWKIDNFYLLCLEYLKFTLKKILISFQR